MLINAGSCGTVQKKLKFDQVTPVSFEEDSNQPVYEHSLSKCNTE